jgi:glutamate 5-kinase
MLIARGDVMNPLAAIEQGARVTWFLPTAEPLTARKRWIAGSVAPSGTVVVDDGAARALAQGSSLLPAGVKSVEGTFERGDAILVRRLDGATIARGLSAYASGDVARILGHKSGEIEALLGYRGRDEIIHRDDLVVG